MPRMALAGKVNFPSQISLNKNNTKGAFIMKALAVLSKETEDFTRAFEVSSIDSAGTVEISTKCTLFFIRLVFGCYKSGQTNPKIFLGSGNASIFSLGFPPKVFGGAKAFVPLSLL